MWMAVSAALLAACGPVESRLADGTYQSTESAGPLVGANLSVDLKGKAVTVSMTGTSQVALQLAEVPRAQWQTGCPTNFSSVLLETWGLSPDPAVLGTLSVATPRLLAGCGSGGANRDEVVVTGTSQPNSTQQHLVFRRVTR